MASPVHLREAVAVDVPEIVRVIRSAKQAAMPWLPDLHTAEGDASFFGNRVLPVQSAEVAEADGALFGFVSFREDWVDHLYVVPEAWRRGIGSRLLRRAMESHGFLQLWVFQTNHAAQAFYHRHGFVVAERTDGSNNEEKCPDIRMTWTKDGASASSAI